MNKQIELAREIVAQAWCTEETSHIEMNTKLAESFANILSGWLEYAAQSDKNASFYREIVAIIGDVFGEEARISDDGSVQEDVLALKVPELVRTLRDKSTAANQRIKELEKALRNMCVVANNDKWYEATTGRQIILFDAQQALSKEAQ